MLEKRLAGHAWLATGKPTIADIACMPYCAPFLHGRHRARRLSVDPGMDRPRSCAPGLRRDGGDLSRVPVVSTRPDSLGAVTVPALDPNLPGIEVIPPAWTIVDPRFSRERGRALSNEK